MDTEISVKQQRGIDRDVALQAKDQAALDRYNTTHGNLQNQLGALRYYWTTNKVGGEVVNAEAVSQVEWAAMTGVTQSAVSQSINHYKASKPDLFPEYAAKLAAKAAKADEAKLAQVAIAEGEVSHDIGAEVKRIAARLKTLRAYVEADQSKGLATKVDLGAIQAVVLDAMALRTAALNLEPVEVAA